MDSLPETQLDAIQRVRSRELQVQGRPAPEARALMSFTREGKGGSKFVKEEDLPAIREQLKNYERMKELVDRWIVLSMELSNLRLTRRKA